MIDLPKAPPELEAFFHRWLETFSACVRDVDYASACKYRLDSLAEQRLRERS